MTKKSPIVFDDHRRQNKNADVFLVISLVDVENFIVVVTVTSFPKKTSTEPKTVTLDVLEPFLAFASATCHRTFQVLLRKNYRNLDPLLATSIRFF